MKSHVMKRRLLVFSLLTVPVMASAQPPEWQTVVGSDLRFRLEMPAPAAKTTAAEKEKGHAGERVAELRARLEKRLQESKLALGDLQALATEKAKAAAHATDEFVHAEPWKAVGIAAALALALGVLIGRR